MATSSTVWAALATPNSPVGSIPFVAADGASIITDVLNFFYTGSDGDTSGNKFAGQATIIGGVRIGYQTRVSTPGNVTINKVSGRAVIPAASSAITITCDKCFSDSIVLVQLLTADSTLTRVVPVVYDGYFVLSGNAAATANTTVGFIINNVAP